MNNPHRSKWHLLELRSSSTAINNQVGRTWRLTSPILKKESTTLETRICLKEQSTWATNWKWKGTIRNIQTRNNHYRELVKLFLKVIMFFWCILFLTRIGATFTLRIVKSILFKDSRTLIMSKRNWQWTIESMTKRSEWQRTKQPEELVD